MLKFILILVAFFIIALASFFYFGSRDYKVIRPGGKANAWSEQAKNQFSVLIRLCFKLFAVALLLNTVVPMVRDIPALVNGQVVTMEGRFSSVNASRWYLRQTGVMNATSIYFYFPPKPITRGTFYRVSYLSHSHFGISVQPLK